MRLAIRIQEYQPDVVRASCPSLPGCVVYGRTRDEARRRLEEVVKGYMATRSDALPTAPEDRHSLLES
jgi:predicted RNase H-like HicB family nuclease